MKTLIVGVKMKRRDLLKGLAGVMGSAVVVTAGQKIDSNKKIIVNLECGDCGWRGKFPLEINKYGFYQATEAMCPKCFSLLDQVATYEENPTLETSEQKRQRHISEFQTHKKEFKKQMDKLKKKDLSYWSAKEQLERAEQRLEKLNGIGK
jgi:hypothetical protein